MGGTGARARRGSGTRGQTGLPWISGKRRRKSMAVSSVPGGDVVDDAAIGAQFELTVAPLDGVAENAGGPHRETEEVAQRNQPEIASHLAVAQNAGAHPDAGHDPHA